MRRIEAVWLHGLASTAVGALLVWASLGSVLAREMTDLAGQLLYWPERPALELRLLLKGATAWVVERKSLNDRLAEVERENLSLRGTLAMKSASLPKARPDLLPARVTLRTPEAWWKEIRVDRGSRDGVRVGAPALADGYLIGRVSRVGPGYAWVELLTSSTLLLAVVVEETRDLGVVAGDDAGNVWLLYIPRERPMKRGMHLSSALVGEGIPPGVPVGIVLGPGEPSGGFVPQRVALGGHLTQLYGCSILLPVSKP
jgi:rod shape-determining protein MreC